MRSWLVALRIARREALRAKGRTLLIVAMITMPVLVLTFAAAVYKMNSLTTAESQARRFGAGNALVTWQGQPDPNSKTPTHATADQVARALPAGSTMAPFGSTTVTMRTASGIGDIDGFFFNASDPILTPMVKVASGRVPQSDAEVAVSKSALSRLGTKVGGSITMPKFDSNTGMFPAHTYTVVGVVQISGKLTDQVLFSFSQAGDLYQQWVAKTPRPLTKAEVAGLNTAGFQVAQVGDQPAVLSDTARGFTLFGIGTVVAGLGILEVVLLAGPAFAVGARRRQRDLALTAANGASPATVRKIVLGDGVVSGTLAAVVGISGGIIAAFTTRGLVAEYVTHEAPGGYRVYPLALVIIALVAILTGVLGATVPAFTVARQDVVAALAGRRGVTRSRKVWLVLGIIGVALGAVLAAAGAYRTSSNVVLAGLVTGELGLVLCTPTIVGAIAQLGRFLPVTARIALRDTARRRSAAAPAISAVMAAVAGSVALTVYLGANDSRDNVYQQSYPTGSISVFSDNPQDQDRAAALLRQQLPTATVLPIMYPDCGESCYVQLELPANLRCPVSTDGPVTPDDVKRALADRRCDDVYGDHLSILLVQKASDGADALGLTDPAQRQRVNDALASGTSVATVARFVDASGHVSVSKMTFSDAGGQQATQFQVPAISVPAGNLQTLLVTPAEMAPMAVTKAVANGVLAVPGTILPQSKRDAIDAALVDAGLNRMSLEFGPATDKHPIAIILAVAAALIALGAAAISTGLAAADGRSDLTTLAAVGASPRVRRQLSLSQSGVIALLGSALGVAAGLGAATAVLTGLNQVFAGQWPTPPKYPITMPWLNLLISLIVVPVIAMLGAGLLTRSRLPSERRAD